MSGGFNGASGVAVDSSGNLFVVDTFNSLVKEVLAAGGYTTVNILGSGFNSPSALAVDGSGNVFVADQKNNAVKEIVAAGGYTTVLTLGSGFNKPFSVALDGSGNVFVADTYNGAVKEILAAGRYTTVNTLGTGIAFPFGVAVDSAGNVFVADIGKHAIEEILAAGGYTTTNTLISGLNSPISVAVDASDNVIFADQANNSVQELVAANGYATLNNLGSGFTGPTGVALDGSGNVFVADQGNNAIKMLTFASAAAVSFPTLTAPGTIDTTDGTKVVTLTNDGTLALNIASIAPSNGNFTFTGSASTSPFTGTPACGATLASSAFCSIGITFTPQMSGSITANGNVTDNNLNVANAVQAVALSGQSAQISQTITFPQPATPAPAGSAATLTATASSGLPVTYSIKSGPATVIAADQAGNVTYSAAPTVSTTVTTTAAASSFAAPTEPVGTASPTQTAYVTFTTAGTPSTISVVSQGATGLDFNFVSGGTCNLSTSYTVGQVCSVQYTFTPMFPLARSGGVTVADSSGNVLANSYLSGVGTGPLAVFPPLNKNAVTRTLATGQGNVEGVAVDGSGNVYITTAASSITELVAVNGVIPASPVTRTFTASNTPVAAVVDGSGKPFCGGTIG